MEPKAEHPRFFAALREALFAQGLDLTDPEVHRVVETLRLSLEHGRIAFDAPGLLGGTASWTETEEDLANLGEEVGQQLADAIKERRGRDKRRSGHDRR